MFWTFFMEYCELTPGPLNLQTRHLLILSAFRSKGRAVETFMQPVIKSGINAPGPEWKTVTTTWESFPDPRDPGEWFINEQGELDSRLTMPRVKRLISHVEEPCGRAINGSTITIPLSEYIKLKKGAADGKGKA